MGEDCQSSSSRPEDRGLEFGGKKSFIDGVSFGSGGSFPTFFWEAPVSWLAVGKASLGGLLVFSTPAFTLSIPERYRQSLLVAWPRALWEGMQLLSDIPVAAQTQWHFIKSRATPSALSVCWFAVATDTLPGCSPPCHTSVSSITNTSTAGLFHSLPAANGHRGHRVRIKTSSPARCPRLRRLRGWRSAVQQLTFIT